MIRKLDWYIFKRFMLTFIAMLSFIIVISIIFDLSEKIDKMVSHEAPLRAIALDYYANWVPYFVNMFSPLIVFLSVILFTSRLAANSEVVAILSCGVSYRRFLLPYMVAATLIAGGSLALNHLVIPKSNAVRLDFEKKYIKDNTQSVRDAHYQIAPGEFVYAESYSDWNKTAYRFTIESIDENHQLTKKISAESASFVEDTGMWSLKRWDMREYNGGLEETLTMGDYLDTTLNITNKDFYFNENAVQALDYYELRDMISAQKLRGDANVMYAEIERDNRSAMPFSAFILTIMGVALSSRKKRGGIGWNLAIGIALSFSYILFQRFSQMFVYTGLMSSIVALWIPNVLYSFVAIYLYSKAQK